MSLQPHQQRVVEEHAELKDKLDKLHAFLKSDRIEGLSFDELQLLYRQGEAMSEYLNVLKARMAGFDGMKYYRCHKLVKAKPMTRKEYNDLRGWSVPDDENPADEGFLVEYIDGGQQNHPDYAGYISWSPKDVFQRGYKEELR